MTSPQAPKWPYPAVELKPQKHNLIQKRHPWIYSGALIHPPQSHLVRILDQRGQVVAVGTANPTQSLAVRIFHYQDKPLDATFFQHRFEHAIALRDQLGLNTPNAGCRWVFGEADGLPGLVVDRYAHALVIQVGTAGLECTRDIWWPILYALARERGITVFVERSKGGRKLEGLPPSNRIIEGSLGGPVTIHEGPVTMSVNLLKGQKTGTFLDQRAQRLNLGKLASDAKVLNVFGYTGGFSLHAGAGGAQHVTTVDISKRALDLASADWTNNNLPQDKHTALCGDAFDILETLPSTHYDRVIVDPPAFAKQKKDLPNATRAYQRAFSHGAKLTSPGGMLWCYSCSSHIHRERFQEIVWSAIRDAHRQAQVIAHVGQPADHPFLLDHPEGHYLKGLWLRFLD